ncbi:MAG: tRNA (5-methylaminomethyl-2-thiouridine)(34)-methyltransferase MnmD [Gammaproteobacteria bacterium]|nr:tRNA (5-methylaminomethyl-2-thiouridine)(34)-methyltransferase MnmD [Gammaproteobacteria bacterium]
MLKPITPAHIHWDEFGLPLNAQDVYRSHLGSKDLGLDQAQKVFLQGCQLSGRGALWETQDHWVILELGFGLGLNFLATWQEWKNNRLRPKRLYYVALEANPARAEDILRSTQVWPELMPLAQVLVDDWWGLDAGLHTLRFERGQLHLLLSLGQAQETLHSLQLVADSVYLDGFSPTSNPEMWSFDVLSAIAKHSHKTTRLATWCVAKEVVNNLHALGFKCEKVTGLPPKKFSLVAKNNDNLPDRQSILPQKCLVLGHGIAGASVAQQLAACGWQVSVFDVAKGLSPASQVPIALVYPHVNQSGEGLGQLTRQGLRALFNHLPLLPDFSYQMSGVDEQFQGRKAKQFAENKLFQTPDWLKACSAKGWLHQPAG